MLEEGQQNKKREEEQDFGSNMAEDDLNGPSPQLAAHTPFDKFIISAAVRPSTVNIPRRSDLNTDVVPHPHLERRACAALTQSRN